MATLTIRKLDEDLKSRLRVRAARNGHSMEQEAREILNRAMASEPVEDEMHWVDRIVSRFARSGGGDIPEVSRTEMPRAIKSRR
jgi:plasmid stability protein